MQRLKICERSGKVDHTLLSHLMRFPDSCIRGSTLSLISRREMLVKTRCTSSNRQPCFLKQLIHFTFQNLSILWLSVCNKNLIKTRNSKDIMVFFFLPKQLFCINHIKWKDWAVQPFSHYIHSTLINAGVLETVTLRRFTAFTGSHSSPSSPGSVCEHIPSFWNRKHKKIGYWSQKVNFDTLWHYLSTNEKTLHKKYLYTII